MIGGRLGRPNRLTPARARATVDALADAGDVAGLRRFALTLPALVAFTYERRRAAAFALALEGKVEGALSELALGRAGLWTSSEQTAEDAAAVRRLAGGDPAGRPPRLDVRAMLGVAAVAATVVIAVGVTVRLAAVEAPLSVIEAPPERADTFVRTPRLPPTATPSPARERAHDDAAAPNPARVLRTRAELRGADAGRGSRPIRATPRSSKARPAAPTAPAAPEPEPPAPIEPPAAPTPTAAPAAPSTPAADPTPAAPAAAPAPAPPPPDGHENGRRRSHEKQPRSERPKEHEQPEQHEQSAPAVAEAAPAAAAPPEPAPTEPQQPASDPGHGSPPHASNDKNENEDKDRGPKEKPEKEKR